MALTQSHITAPEEHTTKNPLAPQEEQVVRMRAGDPLAPTDHLELASGDNVALKERLLALEAQILARAPEPRRMARLRLVPDA